MFLLWIYAWQPAKIYPSDATYFKDGNYAENLQILEHNYDKKGSTGPAFLWFFFAKITLGILIIKKFMLEGLDEKTINLTSFFCIV